MAGAKLRARASEEGVRTYRATDRSRFLELYEAVWSRRKGRAWFEWRFEANPYAEEVAMVVAEEDGELVGAEPLLPFPVRVGDRTLDALQPVDWMVHPDHRRCGHFTRMTEAVLERYAPTADLLFNFPNEQLRPCLEPFGWEVAGQVPTGYRVQRPRALAGADGGTVATAASVCEPLVRGFNGLVDRLAATPDDVAVERHDGVPVQTVRKLYRETRPDRIHVPRERAFLEWRFDNPRWETTTYVARRDDEAVASAVIAREPVDGAVLARLLDVQPMCDPASERTDAVRALLAAVVADEDAALLTAPPACYPQLLRQYGFRRDDAFPLSAVASQTTFAVRTRETGESVGGAAAAGPGRCADGRDLTDASEWLLTPADTDVA